MEFKEIWVATGNSGKLNEFKLALRGFTDLKIRTQNEISGFSARPEDGKTFLDNARIKARSLRAIKNKEWVLADDSGLEVEGLGGLPGVHSARYAGPKAADSENVAKLLKMMSIRPIPNRNAKFVSMIVVYTPEGEEWVFSGEFPGKISTKAVGQMGFGYDPVFIPEGQEKTLGELGAGYKAQHSHRALAMNQFLERLRSAISSHD